MKPGLKIIKLSLIDGYKSEFKNRESKSGGGVGFYIKEHMNFNVRQDLRKIDESIEILWTEVQRRNENTPVLSSKFLVHRFLVSFEPSSNETEKLI